MPAGRDFDVLRFDGADRVRTPQGGPPYRRVQSRRIRTADFPGQWHAEALCRIEVRLPGAAFVVGAEVQERQPRRPVLLHFAPAKGCRIASLPSCPLVAIAQRTRTGRSPRSAPPDMLGRRPALAVRAGSPLRESRRSRSGGRRTRAAWFAGDVPDASLWPFAAVCRNGRFRGRKT